MAMLQCSKCGHVYDDSNAYCTNCGQPTKDSMPDAAPTAQPSPEATTAQQTWQPTQNAAPHQTAPNAAPYQTAQQVPNYAQYRPQTYIAPSQGKAGGGFGWIVFMRVILWIFFGLILLSALVTGVIFMSEGDEYILIGFAFILGGTLVAFLSVAMGMISLNNASNLYKIATNSARILDELQKKK